MDVDITTAPSSSVNDAEQAVRLAQEALADAQLATRAAESSLVARRADETEAQRTYDRALELVRDLYVAERHRLEEAARAADAALKELDDKLHSLRSAEAEPTAADPVAVAPVITQPHADGEAPVVDPEATTDGPATDGPTDADGDHADADAEDWLAALERESENERRDPDGA